MSSDKHQFTAAQIAAELEITPQAVRKHLRGTTPVDTRRGAGKDAAVWTVSQLPPILLNRLARNARRQDCSIEVLLAGRRQLRPALPLSYIHQDKISEAEKLREALRPFLIAPREAGLTAEEWKQRGADYYFRIFKKRISPQHWDRLYRRTEENDNGVQNWDAIHIYLGNRLKRKPSPSPAPIKADELEFASLETYLRSLRTPGDPDEDETIGIWQLAIRIRDEMIESGEQEKRASRRVREFLYARAPFLASTKDALWIAFKRKIAKLKNTGHRPDSIADHRAGNGPSVEIPAEDLDRLRHSATFKNGNRQDAAWREEYHLLSETTRQRYPRTTKTPDKIRELLNREAVDLLGARHQGKRKLRRMLPTIRRDWTGIPSMHSWVVDDMTSVVEVALKNQDGSTKLLLPQIIAVMDSVSRKFVGWTVSDAQAPNARIVCDAVRTAFKIHGVPKRLGLENGFVFGKSFLVNGQEDNFGRTVVVGLGHFGCEVHHFEKMNPTSKSELEYGFNQIQCLMERWPGYGGRNQRLDAPEDFILERRLIEAGRADPAEFRMTFDEFIVQLAEIILQYNSTPQGGRLKRLSPNQAFLAGIDAEDPPIQFTPKLEWLLSDRQLVPVKVGGVNFTYLSTREKIQVIGGPLLNMVGQYIWALMDPRDTSIVTFMTTDYSKTFTMEVAPGVSASQRALAPESDALEMVRSSIRECERAANDEYNRLKNQFGNPRRDLLAQIRNQSGDKTIQPWSGSAVRRINIVSRKMFEAGEQMEEQRAAIVAAKDNKNRRTAANKSKARRMDIPAVLVDDDEQSRRALELLGDSPRAGVSHEEITEGNE